MNISNERTSNRYVGLVNAIDFTLKHTTRDKGAVTRTYTGEWHGKAIEKRETVVRCGVIRERYICDGGRWTKVTLGIYLTDCINREREEKKERGRYK